MYSTYEYAIIEKLETLVWRRFKNKEELEKCLSKELFKLPLVDDEIENADELKIAYITKLNEKIRYSNEELFDYNLLWVIADLRNDNDDENVFCDFDIYYLFDNAKNLYITELWYEFQ